MARTSSTKAAVEETVEAVEKVDEIKKETKKVVQPLKDDDEIAVVSLIPNVSYKDNVTGDMYEWDEAGHIEYMTFATLKNMQRNNRGYFRHMWLKPDDERVINKFGLTSTYKKYEFLMDESNYTKQSIDEVCKTISDTPRPMKRAICGKIKNLVINEKISDASVIRKLEKHLNLDLMDFL